MCGFAPILLLGSTLLGAAGQMSQARAQAQSANYQSQLAQMNAQIAEARSRDAIERGQVEESQKRQQVSNFMGRQKVAFARNNVDMRFGSPLDSIVDTATLGEMDALTIRANAAREAYDHRVGAANARAQSSLYKMEEKMLKRPAGLGREPHFLVVARVSFQLPKD